MQNGEYLLEIRFRRSKPAISDILDYHTRHTQLAGPTLHDKRLAGPDAPRNEVSHGKRIDQTATQEFGVFTQPGLDGLVPRNLIEREWGFEKLQQTLTLALDQLFLHPHQPCCRD